MKKIAYLAAAAVTALAVQSTLAHEAVYSVVLNGPSEAPANASPGTGVGTVTFDLDLVKMRVQTTFSGLTGNVTASHIHAATTLPGTGTAGVATQTPTFSGFPLGVTSGTYDNTFDMTVASSYNSAFITANGGTVSGALNALLFAADGGKAYLNIHSSTFPGGEIRGFLVPIPEPTSLAGLAFGGLLLRRKRSA